MCLNPVRNVFNMRDKFTMIYSKFLSHEKQILLKNSFNFLHINKHKNNKKSFMTCGDSASIKKT